MGLVQYNSDGPNRTNIRSRCRQMLNKTFGATPFDRLVAITRQRSGKRCVFDIDQSGVTDAISFEKHLLGRFGPTAKSAISKEVPIRFDRKTGR